MGWWQDAEEKANEATGGNAKYLVGVGPWGAATMTTYDNMQGGYLGQKRRGGSIDTNQFNQPFLPYGAPPTYNPSGVSTPNREALDFLKGYGTQPLDQQSPWAKMQQQLGERQLSRNLGQIDTQALGQSKQMMGDVSARGGLDPASAARISQTASRAGMQAGQGARGDHMDFMSGVGSTDLQQRLGASGKVAGLEPSYASQAGADERYKYGADFAKWKAMQQVYGDAELAKALGGSGSSSQLPSNFLQGNPWEWFTGK